MTSKCYFSPKECGICDSMNWDQIDAMQDLIIHVLNPLREAYGKPIIVNSGFRTQEHNIAIGGALKSQHCDGTAIDISGGSPAENKKIYVILKKMTFDQLIDEKNLSWIHVSFVTTRKNRQQELKL